MKLRREARTLKAKAVSSLRRALSCFNGYDEDGRVTTTLLHLQHACEMLLKAALVQTKVDVFDRKLGLAIGFEKCLVLARQHCGLSEQEAGVMRAVDSLRDASQHWIIFVAEDILYLHARGIVTAFDDILKRSLDDDLASHLPSRVLPVSTSVPTELEIVVDREYSQINDLLKPGRRARDEARGRIRALLALEAHTVDQIQVSEKDINRIEYAIRNGRPIHDVFPRLSTIESATTGEGTGIKVHFTKKQGAPVHFVPADDPGQAAAVREVDLQRKFHMQATQLATRLKLTGPKSAALRRHLNIDADSNCSHVFEFGRQRIRSYSDNALRRMEECLKSESIDDIWSVHRR